MFFHVPKCGIPSLGSTHRAGTWGCFKGTLKVAAENGDLHELCKLRATELSLAYCETFFAWFSGNSEERKYWEIRQKAQ